MCVCVQQAWLFITGGPVSFGIRQKRMEAVPAFYRSVRETEARPRKDTELVYGCKPTTDDPPSGPFRPPVTFRRYVFPLMFVCVMLQQNHKK